MFYIQVRETSNSNSDLIAEHSEFVDKQFRHYFYGLAEKLSREAKGIVAEPLARFVLRTQDFCSGNAQFPIFKPARRSA